MCKGAEELLYAPAFNHQRERHLDGAAFDLVGRPSLLIASARNALATPPSLKAPERSPLRRKAQADGDELSLYFILYIIYLIRKADGDELSPAGGGWDRRTHHWEGR